MHVRGACAGVRVHACVVCVWSHEERHLLERVDHELVHVHREKPARHAEQRDDEKDLVVACRWNGVQR